ncbi:MAG: ribonuclease [Mycobacteriaceae bacterium]|nr:ribonuclease [Mycobacteriaceae bacterium]
MAVRKKPSAVAIALGLLAILLCVAGVLALRSANLPPPARDSGTSVTPGAGAPTGRPAEIPANAWQTLRLIDEGQWPPPDSPATKGGTTWNNRESRLPRRTQSGAPITYREWDVNRKQQGRTRDAERIVTGSDGTAWYTGDHYRTFTRMR